jgi:hypothetical protein
MDVSWARTEHVQGARHAGYVELVDKCVAMANAHGLQPLVVVLGTPSWANGRAGGGSPPSDPNHFRDFMRWAAERYRGQVPAWQIYNEPNGSVPVADYVSLLKAGYEGVKLGDPSATVISAGIVFNDVSWVHGLYENGAKDHFDALGAHPYQSKADEPPEYIREVSKWWFANLYKVHEAMAANGDGHKPIWITEFGYSAHSNATIPLDSVWAFGVTEAQQADYSVRAFKYARANWPWLGIFFYYKEISWPLGSLSPSWFDLHTQGYGLLYANGTERPVYRALKTYLTGN